MQGEDIDFVVTWVDGNDPAHAAKRAKYLPQGVWGGSTTRFAALDEIRYCLLSILRHAPFARRIFVVTDAQTPPALAEIAAAGEPGFEKITLVDHRDIFRGYDDILPVFCSTSIDLMLHRIPGLAEQFVVMNDDFILSNPCTPQDFFDGGKVVLRGQWFGPSLDVLNALDRALNFWKPIHKRTVRSKEKARKSARLAGMRGKTFMPFHAPYCLRQSTCARAMEQFESVYLESVRVRFRRADKLFAWALSDHMEILAGKARVLGVNEAVFIMSPRNSPEKIRKKLEQAKSAKFLCVQSLDQAAPQMQREIGDWLAARFPLVPKG
jgi:hypothetical protein